MPLMTMQENLRYNNKKKVKEIAYLPYDNYKAIEIPFVDAIPSDYPDVMGVPISFIDKYCPEQFDIIGADFNVKDGKLDSLIRPEWQGKLDRAYLQGKRKYSRIFIKHKHPAKPFSKPRK